MMTTADGVEAQVPTRMSRLLATASAGAVIGVLDVVIVLSFVSLIFSGDWSVHIPAASAVALVGTAIILGGIALSSTVPGVMGTSQDTSTAVLATVAASIATQMDPATDEAFLTLVLAMMLSSVALAIVLFSLGALRLGDLIRYVPYPVIGGFLAGTGWLLLKGALSVLTGLPVALSTLDTFARTSVMAKWLPGVALVILLMYFTRRSSHPLVLPGTLAAATAGFFLAVIASGNSASAAEVGGWFIGPFHRTELWEPWAFEAWAGADWSVLAGETGNLATLIFLALMGTLLNATGSELILRRDADLNRELISAGGANLVAGLFGAIPGYHALSFGVLGHRLGARGRAAGVVAAGVCLAAMFLAPVVLARTPRFLLGGLLLFLGLSLINDWIISARSRLPAGEFAVVVSIALMIAAVGFVEGVALGLVLSIILFVVSYSRTGVAKHQLSGANFHSNVERPIPHMDVLRIQGERIHILELEGFLFFGTAHRVLQALEQRLRDTSRSPLTAFVLEFRQVTSIDASAAASIMKIHRLAAERGFVLVLTGINPQNLRRLERAGVTGDDFLEIFEDIDRGLQWCEDRVLEDAGALTPSSVAPPVLHEFPQLQQHLERLEVPPGHVLIAEGETSREVFFLQSGRLAAQIGTEGSQTRIRSMGPGTIVGEIGAYLGGPRSASVVAEDASVVYRLVLDDLDRVPPDTAAAIHRMFASIMAQRLADNVRLVEALRR